jgi:hypothetical protein
MKPTLHSTWIEAVVALTILSRNPDAGILQARAIRALDILKYPDGPDTEYVGLVLRRSGL